MFSVFRALFRPSFPAASLYLAVVAKAREPDWYRLGGVPDTVDGRFDMVLLIYALVHRALERGDRTQGFLVNLTERFVDDMDESLREMGIGDMVLGKHIGRIMGALGGRLAAYRTALDQGEGLAVALSRNLYRGAAPTVGALDWTVNEVTRLAAAIDALTITDLKSGHLP